jgi:hypothetical protein
LNSTTGLLFASIVQAMISEKTVEAAVVENSKNISSNAAVVVAEEITEVVAVVAVITVEVMAVVESLKRDINNC